MSGLKGPLNNAWSVFVDESLEVFASGLWREQAMVLAWDSGPGLTALPSRYERCLLGEEEARSIAEDHLRRQNRLQPENDWNIVGAGDCLLLPGRYVFRGVGDPNVESLYRGRVSVAEVDSFDGHVWGREEKSVFEDERFIQFPYREKHFERLVSGLPAVIQTRLRALGEPWRSGWYRVPETGRYFADVIREDPARISRRLGEQQEIGWLGLFVGLELHGGVFRRRRLVGERLLDAIERKAPVHVTRGVRWQGEVVRCTLDIAAVWSSLSTDGSVLASVAARSTFWRDRADQRWCDTNGWDLVGSGAWLARLEEDVRELIAGAPTIAIREPHYFGIDAEGYPFVFDDDSDVFVEYLWEYPISDRYALFEEPSWVDDWKLAVQ